MELYINQYLAVNLKDYENLKINLPINLVILATALGACIAILTLYFQNKAHHVLIKSLFRHVAFGEERAKSLNELGLANNFTVRRAILSGGRLRTVVLNRNAVTYTYEEYVALSKKRALPKNEINFDTALFYIPSDKRHSAERILERSSTSALRTLLSCILILALFICISLCMPEILSLIDNALAG